MSPVNEHKLITFDSDFNIRILDADKHAASANLQDSCASFESRVEEVRHAAARYIESLEKVAKCMEAEKLRAIGLRNRVAALRQEQDLEHEELEMTKCIRQKELDNLTQEEKSLQLVIQEQEAQLARLKGTCAS
jgi:intraflagellar transport protein 20